MAQVLCSSCGTGVSCLACAAPIFARLVSWLRGEGLHFEQRSLHLALANRDSLGQVGGDRHTLGVTVMRTTKFLGRDLHTEVREVQVAQGLDIVLFQAVALHELGHVWLGTNGINALPEWAAEGLGQLLAWRFVSRIRNAEGRACSTMIQTLQDPVYGDGFRRVRKIAESVGFGSLIDELRRERRMPILSK